MACLFGHKWDGCKCEICGKIRDEKHSWRNGICDICGDRQDGLEKKPIKETYRQPPIVEQTPVIKTVPASECLFCGQSADYDFHALLKEFTPPILIGGIKVHICKNCYSKKENIFMKKARKSRIIGRILIAIPVTLILFSLFIKDFSTLLAIGCSIGAFQAAMSALKAADDKIGIILLNNESTEKFCTLFGDDNLPNKTIEKQDVFFKYNLLGEVLTNKEEISHENVSENISLDSYSSCKITTLENFLVGLTEIEKNAIRDLMETSI